MRSRVKGIEILCGIECDILEDATMDLPDDVLAEADWVIAVLHYGLKQPREQIMKRLMTAVTNPNVDIIGHCTGRMIGRREGADVNFSELLKAAADHNVMMEINSRIRVDWIWMISTQPLRKIWEFPSSSAPILTASMASKCLNSESTRLLLCRPDKSRRSEHEIAQGLQENC